MLVSVFTPSHHPHAIDRAYQSLVVQSYNNWEWVILVNGAQRQQNFEMLTRAYAHDTRVRVVYGPDSSAIGLLKSRACQCTRGEILVELDHDDELLPTCLATLVRNMTGKECFAYSDTLHVDDAGNSVVFSEAHGWQTYHYAIKGKTHQVHKQFAITPRSLAQILYSPDHVRAWSRSLYTRIGGHNEKLAYADDHELMIRTYLAGAEFVHIREPLYIYSRNEHNTFTKVTKEIQQQSDWHMVTYTADLVSEWCRRNRLPMYDLGGAHNSPAGYIPVDVNLPQDVDGLRHDVLDLATQLKPNSVGCFRLYDFLEHVAPVDVIKLFNLLYELLVPGGYVLTATPAVSDDAGRVGRGAFQDPTHVSFWSANNFWYYTHRNYAKYIPQYRGRFQPMTVRTYYPSGWHESNFIPYVQADLVALKEENKHWPGLVHI